MLYLRKKSKDVSLAVWPFFNYYATSFRRKNIYTQLLSFHYKNIWFLYFFLSYYIDENDKAFTVNCQYRNEKFFFLISWNVVIFIFDTFFVTCTPSIVHTFRALVYYILAYPSRCKAAKTNKLIIISYMSCDWTKAAKLIYFFKNWS